MIITSTLAIKVNTNVKVFGGSLHGKDFPFSHEIQTLESVNIEGEKYNVVVFQKMFSDTQKFTYATLIHHESNKDDFVKEIYEDFNRLVDSCTQKIKYLADIL